MLNPNNSFAEEMKYELGQTKSFSASPEKLDTLIAIVNKSQGKFQMYDYLNKKILI